VLIAASPQATRQFETALPASGRFFPQPFHPHYAFLLGECGVAALLKGL